MHLKLRQLVSLVIATAMLATGAPLASAQDNPSVSQDPAANRSPASASSSPHARVPDDVMKAKAIQPRAPLAVPLPINPLDEIVFDTATRTTTVIAAPVPSLLPDSIVLRQVEPYSGPLQAFTDGGASPDSIIGGDGRVQVSPANTFPWRTIVSIYVTFPNGDAGGCTGEMIDAYRIYTAGHCVHNGQWYSTLTVYPGRDGDSMPYHLAKAVTARSYTGWTVSADHQHDWAVVTLDRRIGNFTGWMGRITRGCSFPYLNGFGCDGLYFGTWNTAGYPDTAPDGSAGNGRMYYDADGGLKANDNNHWYYNDTRPGNSGGPVWYYDGTNRYIGTIHAYGDDGSGANHGTRLNQDKYDRTNSWLTDGGDGAPPTDRPDLFDDGVQYFYGSPTTVVRGLTSMSVGSDVRNNGTAAAGGHWNRYVFSTNTFIGTADYTVCEAFVASVGTFTWNNSDCGSFILGSGVPAGTYYLGVIYDVYGQLAEFDETNNTAYRTTLYTVQDPYRLTVSRNGTGSGTVTSAPAGINCGADCLEDYAPNTSVTLTATATADSAFVGWTGSCTGVSATCVVSMNAARAVTASFVPRYTLSVSKLGSGTGTVTSAPAGINCGADCSESYLSGASVTLTPAAAAGSVFVGWGGDCTGTGACVVSMTGARSVSATFNIPAELASFVLTKSEIAGCKSVTGKLTLNVVAPAGGFKVTVTDTLANATPPATVTIPEGVQTKSFSIKSTAVSSKRNGTVTAKGTVATFSQPLSLREIGMLSVTLAPNPVAGGLPVSGTAKLECEAGPAAITAALSSSLPAVANPTVASVSFPIGVASMPFTVNTTAVAAVTKPKIIAVANGISKNKVLTVNP